METKMKVAIYCRVSTEEQRNEIQEEICLKYCQNFGHDVYKVYTDTWTGASSKRPNFNVMLEDMRKKEFEAVVVTKLDRIGRSLKHLLSLFDEFKSKDIKFIAVQQNIDTNTSIGQFFMHILGAFAEFERNLISERTKDGLRARKSNKKRGADKKRRNNAGYLARWAAKRAAKPEYASGIKSNVDLEKAFHALKE